MHLVESEQHFANRATDKIIHDVAADARDNVRWEPYTEAFIDAIGEAKTYVDCGAEYGFYIYLALKHGPSNLRIIAFEPDPTRYEMLKKAMLVHANVEVYGEALSNVNGLAVGIKPAPGVSMSIAGLHADGERISIDTIAFDDKFPGESFDVLKMDIEGAEGAALEGMHEALGRCRRGASLFIEFHQMGPVRDALTTALNCLGFIIKRDHGGWVELVKA